MFNKTSFLDANLTNISGNTGTNYGVTDLVQMTIYLAMILPATFGNGLVIRAISQFENLQSSTHILTGSLAAAGKYVNMAPFGFLQKCDWC